VLRLLAAVGPLHEHAEPQLPPPPSLFPHLLFFRVHFLSLSFFLVTPRLFFPPTSGSFCNNGFCAHDDIQRT
jgi:hypothetical protein